ncbi:MAG: oligopeptide/dipeptide ABC transporter ATP-binding protein [Mycobacterium leprae]
MSETLLTLKEIVVLRRLDPRGPFGLFGAKPIRALDGVSLSIGRGETLGIMGGSGSGKTTLAETATLRLTPDRGQILYQGQDVTKLGGEAKKSARRRLQLIRQDARDSLAMEETVLKQFRHLLKDAGMPDDEARIGAALEQVGLPSEFLARTPLAMSGGQQQRLAIARALVVNPQFVAADEPVSGVDPHLALDMLRLMEKAQRERNIAYLLISQDRKVISRLAHRTAVLYAGRLFEVAPTERILTESKHPYTHLFMGQEEGALPADLETAGQTYAGCPWAAHCPLATEQCRQKAPAMREVAPGHMAACHAL